MTPYYDDGRVTIYHGDCVETMRGMDEASVDAIVTDPPYGLEFMGKEWDRLGDTGRGVRVAAERVAEMTPSGRGHQGSKGPYLAARVDSVRAAGPIAQAWHEAWAREALRVLKPGGHLLAFGGTRTYHRLACAVEDAGFEIRDTLAWMYGSGMPKSRNIGGGWGTALKPAYEPVVLARKPLSERNVAANVLAHGTGAINVDACRIGGPDGHGGGRRGSSGFVDGYEAGSGFVASTAGRWPANVVLDEEGARLLDGPSRFFYTAKASRSERGVGNDHPTVKPVALMVWLIRLVTPPGGIVLDPFMGSGTTVFAAKEYGFRAVAVEQDAGYCEIAARRLAQDVLPLEVTA